MQHKLVIICLIISHLPFLILYINFYKFDVKNNKKRRPHEEEEHINKQIKNKEKNTS